MLAEAHQILWLPEANLSILLQWSQEAWGWLCRPQFMAAIPDHIMSGCSCLSMWLQLCKVMHIFVLAATIAMPTVLPKAGMSSASQEEWGPQQQLEQLQPWLTLHSQGSAAAMTRQVFCVQLWMTSPSWWPARSLPPRQLRRLQLWPMPLLLP